MAKNFGKSKATNTLKAVAEKAKSEAIPILLDMAVLKENKDNEFLFGMDGIEHIAMGIRQNGFKGAIEVWDLGNGFYEIYSGHRRKRAMEFNGETQIMCFVYPLPETEAEKRRALLGANLYGRNSVDNSQPIYTARQLEYHKETLKMEGFKGDVRKKLGVEFNISSSQVYKYMSLLKLNNDLQICVKSGTIPMTVGSAISSLDEQKQNLVMECVEKIASSDGTGSITKEEGMKLVDYLKKNGEAKNAEDVLNGMRTEPEAEPEEDISGQYKVTENGEVVEEEKVVRGEQDLPERKETTEQAEIKHFTDGDKVEPYGWTWSTLVRQYLKTKYKKTGSGFVEVLGKKYYAQKMPRKNVTLFYDAEKGTQLFDVENERLSKEYEDLMNVHNQTESEENAEKGQKTVQEEPQELDEKSACPPNQKECTRKNWGLSKEEQDAGKIECKNCWKKYKDRQAMLDNSNKDTEILKELEQTQEQQELETEENTDIFGENMKLFRKMSDNVEEILTDKLNFDKEDLEEVIRSLKHMKELIEDETDRLEDKLGGR